MLILFTIFGVMFLAFIGFMTLGAIFPNTMNDAAGMIFIATLIISGVLTGLTSWIVITIKEQKSNSKTSDN